MDKKSVKNENIQFYCKSCEYKTSNKYNYNRHILSAKHKMDTKNINNIEQTFICKKCNYVTSNKCNYDKHLLTSKHKNDTKNMKSMNNGVELYMCKCGNKYKYSQGLCKHRKQCTFVENKENNNVNITIENVNKESNENIERQPPNDKKDLSNIITEVVKQNTILLNNEFKTILAEQNKDFKNILIEQNKEFQNKMLEISKNQTVTNIQNNVQNNHFNLNVFLNEQCKDAINMEDFLDSIQLTVLDLEETGKLGFVSGISRIFIENIKKMGIHERPLHCTDLKRETVYIKENNKWEKEDTNKSKLNNVVKRIVKKNICQLPNWQKENPGYLKSNTKANDDYIRISLNSLGSEYDDEQKRMDDKIIRNMLKEVVLDKNKELV